MTSGLGVMSRFASGGRYSATYGRFGWDFDTFSSIFGLPIGKVFKSLGLTVWAARLRFTAEK